METKPNKESKVALLALYAAVLVIGMLVIVLAALTFGIGA